MQYRRFGKTEMMLSVFSLGTMRYLESEKNAVATIHQALEHGINHLESAKGYGKSEEFIGAAFRQGLHRHRRSIYVTTKIAPTPDSQSMTDLIQRSLQRLKLDYIDNFDLHGINTWQHYEMVKNPEGCMAAVQDAMKSGLIRHVGFSTHAPLEIILATLELNLFSSVNLHYYYFNQRNRAAVELAHQKDMGVFIISPSDKGGMLYQPSEKLVKLAAPFTAVHLNDRFLLSDTRVHTLSLGAANPTEFLAHSSAWDHDPPLTAAESAALARLDREYLAITDRCSQCFACLPCPEAIQIPEVLRLRNLAVGFEMTEFGKYRYRMFENAGHWFPGKKANKCTDCGDCLPRCPENLDIPTLIRETHDRLYSQEGKRLWE